MRIYGYLKENLNNIKYASNSKTTEIKQLLNGKTIERVNANKFL